MHFLLSDSQSFTIKMTDLYAFLFLKAHSLFIAGGRDGWRHLRKPHDKLWQIPNYETSSWIEFLYSSSFIVSIINVWTLYKLPCAVTRRQYCSRIKNNWLILILFPTFPANCMVLSYVDVFTPEAKSFWRSSMVDEDFINWWCVHTATIFW